MPIDKKYTGLEINLDNVQGWIELYCSKKEYQNARVKKYESGQSIDYEVVHNGGSFSFSFFASKGGRYSLSYKRGKNKVDSKEFVDMVVEASANVNKPSDDNKGYLLHIKPSDFDAFIDLLIDDDISIVSHTDDTQSVKCTIKSIHYRDEITIHYYKTTNNVFIQGKRLQLFDKATDILAGIGDFVQVVNAEIKYAEVDITSDKVIENMKESLGAVYYFLNDAQRAIISSAFKFYRIEIELKDYSPFVQPMCRAMDGFFYKLFKEFDIDVEDNDGEYYGISHFFRSENEHVNPLKLKSEFASKIDNERVELEFNRLYKWYHQYRHNYSHSTDINFTTDVIESRNVADTRFREAVDLYRTVYDTIVEEKRK